jgi:hypothetical protein
MLKLSLIVMDHVKEGFETYDCITIFLFSFKWEKLLSLEDWG